jgi:hypothetical protein
MKKVLFSLLVIAGLTSCGNGASSEAVVSDSTAVVDSTVVVDSTAVVDTTVGGGSAESTQPVK